MKVKNKNQNSNTITLATLIISIVSVLWNIFFGYGLLSGRIDAMQEDITEIKATLVRMNHKMDKGFADIREDLHKHDVRITTPE